MIDFRYHIVSLISVFLALAVGIALGAGPLEETIGNRLTEQVDQLRAEKDELREDLTVAQMLSHERGDYVEAAAQELLAGVLPRAVAVVTLPGADDEVVKQVIDRLGQAGADVTARVAVTETWTDPDQRAFRSSLVGNLAGYLDPGPSVDASADAVLGLALARALTEGAAEAPGGLSENATLVLDVLASGQLVSVTVAPAQPADAVVVVGPSAGASAATPEAVAGLVALADALATESEGMVVAGYAGDDTLVAALRGGDAGQRVATVDTIADVTGQVSVPRAVASAITGSVGHYGFASSAGSVLPSRADLGTDAPDAGQQADAGAA